MAVLIGVLKLTGWRYEEYMAGSRLISFYLGPAVVALGVPLYQQLAEIRNGGKALLVSLLPGSAAGILAAWAGTPFRRRPGGGSPWPPNRPPPPV